MDNILFVNACVRQKSRTFELAEHLLGKMTGNVKTINLYECNLPPVDEAGLENRRSAAFQRDFSDDAFEMARDFAGADVIVIAAPFWDLMFPAVLKSYFETVTVAGITFRYSDKGMPVGLCNAKKLFYVTTSGGYIKDYDFGFKYVEALAQNFYGINYVECFKAEGLDIIPYHVEEIMEEAKEVINKAKI